MGILNITTDSFYDGGKYNRDNEILTHCDAMLAQGDTIIDIGAVSTRPGACQVDEKEEFKRLDYALSLLRNHFPETIISVDTYRSDVAKMVIENYKVNIINDISAGTLDERMFETVANYDVPYILTHIQGTPETMQQKPTYDNLMKEIIDYFSYHIHRLQQIGVKDIIIDPGFGFGKTIEHNYQILNELNKLEIFELPILVGMSRKSMIYKLLDTTPEFAMNGTIAANTLALTAGAKILRVHDVKEAMECIKIVEFMSKINENNEI
jgi:dihydropteroate synthase